MCTPDSISRLEASQERRSVLCRAALVAPPGTLGGGGHPTTTTVSPAVADTVQYIVQCAHYGVPGRTSNGSLGTEMNFSQTRNKLDRHYYTLLQYIVLYYQKLQLHHHLVLCMRPGVRSLLRNTTRTTQNGPNGAIWKVQASHMATHGCWSFVLQYSKCPTNCTKMAKHWHGCGTSADDTRE